MHNTGNKCAISPTNILINIRRSLINHSVAKLLVHSNYDRDIFLILLNHNIIKGKLLKYDFLMFLDVTV